MDPALASMLLSGQMGGGGSPQQQQGMGMLGQKPPGGLGAFNQAAMMGSNPLNPAQSPMPNNPYNMPMPQPPAYQGQ